MTKLLTQQDVQAVTGLSRGAIWSLERAGRFPARRKITRRSIRWIEEEVDAWIQALPKAAEVPTAA